MEARDDRRGRRAHPPEHYAEVAEVYRTAYRLQQSPTQAVADQFKVEKSTAAKYVARARERGLLPQTSRGKPSA
jgi:transposase